MKLIPIARASNDDELRKAFGLSVGKALELLAPCAEGSQFYIAPNYSAATAVQPDGSIISYTHADIVHFIGEYNAYMLKTSRY